MTVVLRLASRAAIAAALLAVTVEGIVVVLFIDTLRRYGLFDRAIGEQDDLAMASGVDVL
jgi:hypothetical protein